MRGKGADTLADCRLQHGGVPRTSASPYPRYTDPACHSRSPLSARCRPPEATGRMCAASSTGSARCETRTLKPGKDYGKVAIVTVRGATEAEFEALLAHFLMAPRPPQD